MIVEAFGDVLRFLFQLAAIAAVPTVAVLFVRYLLSERPARPVEPEHRPDFSRLYRRYARQEGD